jgi:hypothetical protein
MQLSSSWEANSFLVSQDILCILWNSKVCNHVESSPPILPVLSQPAKTGPNYNPKYSLQLLLNIAFRTLLFLSLCRRFKVCSCRQEY